MNTDQIRQTFVRFFEERGHLAVASAPLVAHDDPTVLFTVAGMQPFKAYYSNPALAPARRIVTVQRCIRTNDIDEVGDNTHCTVFEMLGNFAFGDVASGGYFKKEAIAYAYELFTKGFGVDPGLIWPTVWAGEPGIPRDGDATAYWRELGIPEERITPLNRKADGSRENFWGPVGETGPCGPCSEIYLDVLGSCPEGRAEGECRPDPLHECGRFVEVWNLVFNQFFMGPDGSLTPLEHTGIDTGSGFERVAAALLRVPSAYETDLFAPIIEAAENVLDVTYGDDPQVTRALRVIADHTRAATFLVADGVTPSNEARGYVARRLLRRAVRYGRTLGKRGAFLGTVVDAVVERYAPHYPHLSDRRRTILSVIGQEEARFSETLTAGLDRINAEIARLEHGGERTIPGSAAFQLYDTFGFPLELTVEVAEQRGFSVDEEGFRGLLAQQRRRARESAQFRDAVGVDIPQVRSEFVGYERLALDGARVVFLAQEGERVTAAAGEAEVALVLDRTPFYAERGGQVGDAGEIVGPRGRLEVTSTRPGAGETIVHFGRVAEGEIGEDDLVAARVRESERRRTMRHHTATHLLHAALRQVLGPEAHQAGSLVAPNRLRFDFAHGEALSPEQRRSIEQIVGEVIRRDLPVQTDVLSLDDAMKSGAVALFDEKYGDKVRVLTIGDFSKELCGGTHVERTGEIGSFLVLGESSVGSGLRRIEALAGDEADRFVSRQLELLDSTARVVGAARDEVPGRVTQLLAELSETRRKLEAAERKSAQAGLAGTLEQAAEGSGFKVVAAALDPATAPTMERLREASDWVRDKLGAPAVIALGSVVDGRPQLLVSVSPDLTKRGLHAGKLLNEVNQEMGSRGGGRPELAQGGGGDPAKLAAGLERAKRAALAAA
ncbi:MAG TPA: alanine--tRNA ligase [Chloroflexota bacterium]|nr:alanine--tRNA ligase [Chloroflexota bacterium]